MTRRCNRCDGPMVVSPSGRTVYCAPCGRERARRRRAAEPLQNPVSVAGARERLAATLNAIPTDELLERLASLRTWGPHKGAAMRTAAEVDAALAEAAS